MFTVKPTLNASVFERSFDLYRIQPNTMSKTRDSKKKSLTFFFLSMRQKFWNSWNRQHQFEFSYLKHFVFRSHRLKHIQIKPRKEEKKIINIQIRSVLLEMDPSCGYNYYQQVNNYQLTSLDTFDNSTAYYNSMPMTSFESDLVYNHQAQHHQPAVTSTVSLSLSTHSSPGSYQPHQNDSYSPPAINLSSTPKGFDSPYSTNNYVNYYQT